MARNSETRKLDSFVPAMLAKETRLPFSDEGWIYEIKWDGFRAIAEIKKGQVKLYSRNGNSFLTAYHPVVEELSKLMVDAIFDGEIVVLNEEGNPDFQKLQNYELFKNYPVHFYVFDLLTLNGKELYNVPLIERKKLLAKTLTQNDVIKYSDHIEEKGEDFFEIVKQRNLEGIMAKKMDSIYYPGKRSADWLKIKNHHTDEAIIAGFTAPRGGRKNFGALVLGNYINDKLTYIGHTGSGFDTRLLSELSSKLEPLITEKSPFAERVKTNMPVTWLKPEYICEIKFSERTTDGKLRHPIFLRLREDKSVAELQAEALNKEKMKPGKPNVESGNNNKPEGKEKKPKKVRSTIKNPAQSVSAEVSETVKMSSAGKRTKKSKTGESANKVSIIEKGKDESSKSAVIQNEKEKIYRFGKAELKTTNRTKIFFPEEAITKGDVLDYYELMSPYILPYLKNRPESLFRTPNGINQKGFFHKDAGDEAPSWVSHIPLYSESVKKDIDYILCNDAATLLYLVNLGCIEINPWHSKVKSLDNPDYLIIDIDPSDNNTFDQVIEAALVVKEILDQAGAMGICKTSGASGIHIYVPLGAKYNYDQAKDFANIVCMMANAQLPESTTLERSLSKRSKDKIYMDYLQNRKGQTIACVYSLRPKKGATVSTPLNWDEVKKGLTPAAFTIKTVPERIAKMGDLFQPILQPKNVINLRKCIERLGG